MPKLVAAVGANKIYFFYNESKLVNCTAVNAHLHKCKKN